MNSKEKIIQDHEKIINFVLKKMHLTHRKDSLYDAGLIGFTLGINSYDENRGIKLLTYLYKCIKNEILKALNKENLYLERYNPISLNTNVGVENIIELQDFIMYDEDFDRNIYIEEIFDIISDAIIDFTAKQEVVFKHLYGLDGFTQLTETEIAKRYGMSKQYVHDIHKRVINKMKYLLYRYRQNYLDGAYDKKDENVHCAFDFTPNDKLY